jgi:imidazolonepropionase
VSATAPRSTDPAKADRLWHNATLATFASADGGVGLIGKGAIATRDGRIVAAGPAAEVMAAFDAIEIVDLGGRLVTPGLIDCHTHLVYAGSRADEFEQRLAGRTYAEISAAGGGIKSTVRATSNADDETLLQESLRRLDALLAEGVTTVEIKSGYGLTATHEMRQLRAARRLGEIRPVSVLTTLLAAHAIPPEYQGNADAYVDLVCRQTIPSAVAAGLVDAVDAFCEHIAFNREQVARVFKAARDAGVPVKLHADQLSDGGGAALAAEFGALSADHLEYTSEAGIEAMARAGTVAVLLPGAFYMLRERHPPPVALLRQHGVPIALATDCNPGTSPLTSPLLAMNMASTLFGLTVQEGLLGFTRAAAQALGKQDEIGTLAPGKWCDLAIWDVERPAELVYGLGFNPLYSRVWRGK